MKLDALFDALPFRFCPRCGNEGLRAADAKAARCDSCDFLYFHNNAAATGVVIRCDEHVLFVERAHDPAKGLLDIPGGFVDYGESLEQAATRETLEETGIALTRIDYLLSLPNVYRYADVVYQTCDAYFHALLGTRPATVLSDEVSACYWLRPQDVAPERLAFDSLRRLVSRLREVR